MLRWLAVGGGAAVVAAAACTSFSSGPQNAPADAGPTVDSSEPDANDAVDASLCPFDLAVDPNDVVVEDFTATGCDGWYTSAGNNTAAMTECGHACRFCIDSTGTSLANLNHPFDIPDAGGTYRFTAWLRTDDVDDAGVGPNATYLVDTLLYKSAGGELQIPSLTGGFGPTWTKVEGSVTTSDPVHSTWLFINGKNVAPNGCFLVTKVRLNRQ